METRNILKACIRATRSLAELKGTGNTIPNQALLIDSIILQEARVSSEIENIVTTSDNLYKAAASHEKTDDPAIKEVLRYRQALKAGFELLKVRPLNANTLIEIASILMQRKDLIRALPGTTLKNPQTNYIFYTPPEGKHNIENLLSNWEKFLHENEEIDPLVKMAIGHYQLEAIHPFSDGNGRTGRIFNILYLVDKGLLDTPVLYLSYFIINHKQDYYSLLRNVTEKGQWEPWIMFILQGVHEMAVATAKRINDIKLLLDKSVSHCRKELPDRVYSKELIESVFTLPYSRISTLVEQDIAKRQTAGNYLMELTKAGVLQEVKEGREKLYINQPLLDLLRKPWDA